MIESKRLILRKVCVDDLDQLYSNWASDKITNEYLTFKCHESKDETRKMIEYSINKDGKKGFDYVIVLKDTDEIIGLISANKSYKYRCVELGYSIGSKYFNKGYGSEAIRATIEFLFKNCNCDIVEAIIPSNNIASIKAAQKSGLKKEAVLKNRYKNKINGEINDIYIYSVFKSQNNFSKIV